MKRKHASEFPPQVLDLFDRLVHGGLSRREFLERAAKFALAGVSAAAILESLSPNYAWAQQVKPDDARIQTHRVSYASPAGHGTVKGLLAWPAGKTKDLAGVLVVHENRGLNPYIEDVARRLAVAGFVALAPDGLTSVGGYPGNDDEGRTLQRTLDRETLVLDFLASATHLQGRAECSGKVGVIGFCFGGMVSNQLAVRMPSLGAAVPFYGRQPAEPDVAKIKAPLLIHYAETDPRVNAGAEAYEAALKAHGVRYTAHSYPGTNHGFHNDTTPRYNEAAATLAWSRSLAFLQESLR
jgi:carboxymethylenebutenolidase